ncbi:uncharacterized protein LOC116081494 [Mastomys coucha]|uniref:uncharacterized protein LOC116081494 n=1 Tax=Mastomys coucha TaxID=35658 RepID=UPI001261B9A3|nr:uncharacterized protein LOC116081494 [Mastomys coucha]
MSPPGLHHPSSGGSVQRSGEEDEAYLFHNSERVCSNAQKQMLLRTGEALGLGDSKPRASRLPGTLEVPPATPLPDTRPALRSTRKHSRGPRPFRETCSWGNERPPRSPALTYLAVVSAAQVREDRQGTSGAAPRRACRTRMALDPDGDRTELGAEVAPSQSQVPHTASRLPSAACSSLLRGSAPPPPPNSREQPVEEEMRLTGSPLKWSLESQAKDKCCNRCHYEGRCTIVR